MGEVGCLLIADNVLRRQLNPMEQARLIQRLKEQYGIRRGNPNGVNSRKMRELILPLAVSEDTAGRLDKLNALIPPLEPDGQARLIRRLKEQYGIQKGNNQFLGVGSDKMSEALDPLGIKNEKQATRLDKLNALIPPLQATAFPPSAQQDFPLPTANTYAGDVKRCPTDRKNPTLSNPASYHRAIGKAEW